MIRNLPKFELAKKIRIYPSPRFGLENFYKEIKENLFPSNLGIV